MVFLGGMVSQGLKNQLDLYMEKELFSTNTGHRVTALRHHCIHGETFCTQQGGGANYLCSTTFTYRDGVQGYAYVYGSEYTRYR